MYRNIIILMLVAGLNTNIATAQKGKALELDGVNSYMSVANNASLNIASGQNFSVTCWIKSSSSADFFRIANKRGDQGNSSPGYEMIINKTSGQFGVNLRSTSGTNAGPPFGNTPITDGVWHHVAFVVNADNSTVQIYVDGTLEKSQNSAAVGTESFANSEQLYFGAAGGSKYYWNGLIDEIRMWSVPLSVADIQQDMTISVNGNETGLIAAWDFENEQGGVVPDLTGKHTGTLNGGAKCVSQATNDMIITEVVSYQPDIPIGRGEQNTRLASVNFKTSGNQNAKLIQSLSFTSTHPNELYESVRLYYSGTKEKLNLLTAKIIGEAAFSKDSVVFNFSKALAEGNNVFWLVANVSQNAAESAAESTFLSSYSVDNVLFKAATTTVVPRPVLLRHELLFSGGDYGSNSYRIPAIASKGKQVVVVADKRINNNGDLPNNIDLIAKYSEDGGETWSDPVIVADFGDSGASDPALVYDKISGDLLCLFASHNGLFASTPSNKIRFNVVRSSDFGKTWGTPTDFSDQIYLPGWYAAWVASGSAHQLESGRIVAAIGARKNSSNTLTNHMIYSDDNGLTWHVGGQASTSGDEAKIVSTEDGRLMMAIRTPGKRRISWSTDVGQTWSVPVPQNELVEPGVNGDLIRSTAKSKGFDKNRILFSVPNHATQRRNLSVFVSYDEGKTWPVKRTLCNEKSAYSALTAFEDGNIGIFYENGEYENYQLYFAKFSLDWLSGGNDIWSPSVSTSDISPKEYALTVWPNPAKSNVNISYYYTGNQKPRIKIYDTSGQLVKEIKPKNKGNTTTVTEWNTANTANGNYFIRLIIGENQITRKVNIMKQ